MPKLKKYTVYTVDKKSWWKGLRAYNKEDAARRAGFKYTDIGRKIIVEAEK